jgi:sugar lactone lactonase YvrE
MNPSSLLTLTAVAVIPLGLAPQGIDGECALLSPNRQQATEAQLLFTLPEHDLYPENIAFDPASGDYFLSSMGQSRILRIHPDGTYEDFVRGLEPELQSSVGMKVDAQRRRLWVCSGWWTLFSGSVEASLRTGVLLFDLDSGQLLKSWLVEQPSAGHIFNDLTLASNGDAYVTSTLFGRIYRISADANEMEMVLETPGSHNNGITFGPDERYLFFTLDREISRLDLDSGELLQVQVPNEGALGSDGLYYVDGSLISVKPRFEQIVRLHLNEAMDGVDGVEVLAEDAEALAYPTTGVVVGDHLVFVATSYADVPRNPDAAQQHPEVEIRRLRLR